ncbi:ATPase, T2SS/T4P/T4SS family [Comamonas composti]|uniref:ATPase, T2SS/T4P/T4SS family n=1 Tax=Comamonas composti TaxID=408558 RepID=UPI0004119CB3|nr:ATPase, T2SS/T4P/T4SS family [Comamonas composti]
MLQELTDLHLKTSRLEESIVFPGPRPLPEAYGAEVRLLLHACEKMALDDFTIQLQGVTWRGRRDRHAVDGLWYRLRRMPMQAPQLESLPSPLPPMCRSMLLSPALLDGGLIYICGSAGSGKTTTASATVVSRLHQFGGVAYTIEDPPEMPLNGWHGKGYCSQTWVGGERASDWAESFRCALRSQPAATHQMLFVGEVRNADSAHAMLRAASNGFLVIATGFGSDLVSSVDALLRMAGESMVNGIANMLRLVVHQRIMASQMQSSVLASKSSSSPVAARIRAGQLVHLASDIEYQQMLAARGQHLLDN